MRKIILTLVVMALFAGSALASGGWIAGDVTVGSMNPRSYQIEIAEGQNVKWRTVEHITDNYFSDLLHTGFYTVRCTIYDDHGVFIAVQVRTNVEVFDAALTACNFVFSNGTALDRSTWGSIKASL